MRSIRSAAPKSARSGSADDSRSSRRRAGSSLKRKENQTPAQLARLRELLPTRAVRAMLPGMVRPLLALPVGRSWAGAFLDEWCVQVMRSRIEDEEVARACCVAIDR